MITRTIATVCVLCCLILTSAACGKAVLAEGSQSGSELAGIAVKRQIPGQAACRDLRPAHHRRMRGRGYPSQLHPSRKKLGRAEPEQCLPGVAIDFGRTTLILPGDIDQSVEPMIFRDEPHSDQLFWFPPIMAVNIRILPVSLTTFVRRRLSSPVVTTTFRIPVPCGAGRVHQTKHPLLSNRPSGAIEAISDGIRWDVRPANH